MGPVTSTSSPIQAIQALGQSVWLDFMSRQFAMGGELQERIEQDDLRGCTSNPSIFDKAISQSADYDDDIRELVGKGHDADGVYEALTSGDIRAALDLLTETYKRTQGGDGFVSLEVSPLLARDGAQTLYEARKLWDLLDRPNTMIKIPGTPEGLDAIEEALFSGININVTLLFSVAAYEAVAHAYIRALKRRADAGLPLDRIASVASFFVSRIDNEVDKRLDALLAHASEADRARIQSLKGKLAIANAKLAYASYQQIFGTPEFAALKAKGARPQRLLWASTSTKNPTYPDTLYVDELIGPDTVNTMPPETFVAVKDHGKPAVTLTQGLDQAQAQFADLASLGIDIDDVTTLLLDQGIASFAKSFDQLMKSLAAKCQKLKA